MTFKLKHSVLIVFIGLIFSVPMSNYAHVLQHQTKKYHEFTSHQCSDFIHFSVYCFSDTEIEPVTISSNQQIIENKINWKLDLKQTFEDKIKFIRGPPVIFST